MMIKVPGLQQDFSIDPHASSGLIRKAVVG
jgi:hypothetical protein